jgi:hypothetical protein
VDHVATDRSGPITRPRGSRSGREVDQRNAAAEAFATTSFVTSPARPRASTCSR